MLVIRRAQIDAFRDSRLDRFIDRATAQMARGWPQRVASLGPERFRAEIARGIGDARKAGMSEERDLLRIANIAAALGGGFATDPRYPWAKEILGRTALAPSVRVSMLTEETYHELAAASGTG